MAESTQVDLEPEALRSQIEESREALTQKIEQLEEKVTETVQSATASMSEATANVLETVQTATTSVSNTVGSVTNAVHETVDTVRQSVEGTVESVREACDLNLQFQQHPWLMLGGAVAVGVLGANLLGPVKSPVPQRPKISTDRAMESRAHESLYNPPPEASDPRSDRHGFANQEAAPASSWIQNLGQTFGSEIAKLEGLAMGVVLSSIRDMIVEASPPAIAPQIKDVIDEFTVKLGGKPVQGQILKPPNEQGAV